MEQPRWADGSRCSRYERPRAPANSSEAGETDTSHSGGWGDWRGSADIRTFRYEWNLPRSRKALRRVCFLQKEQRLVGDLESVVPIGLIDAELVLGNTGGYSHLQAALGGVVQNRYLLYDAHGVV